MIKKTWNKNKSGSFIATLPEFNCVIIVQSSRFSARP